MRWLINLRIRQYIHIKGNNRLTGKLGFSRQKLSNSACNMLPSLCVAEDDSAASDDGVTWYRIMGSSPNVAHTDNSYNAHVY